MKVYVIKHAERDEYLQSSSYGLKWSPDKARVWGRRGDVLLCLLRQDKGRNRRSYPEPLDQHQVVEMELSPVSEVSCGWLVDDSRRKAKEREDRAKEQSRQYEKDRELAQLKQLQKKYPGV